MDTTGGNVSHPQRRDGDSLNHPMRRATDHPMRRSEDWIRLTDYDMRRATDNSIVSENTVRRRVIIPPGMCGHNSLFVSRIGDWTWDAVYKLCGVNTFNARTDKGYPAYLTFFYYNIKGNPKTHLKLFTVGDEIEVLTRLYKTNAESIYAQHQIKFAPADVSRSVEFQSDLDEMFENPDEDTLYVENYNRWICRAGGEGNEKLLKSSPKNFQFKHLPAPTERYPARDSYRDALANNGFLAMVPDNFELFIDEEDYKESYIIDPVRDINGVGLLYFASYFTIFDQAIYNLWIRLGGDVVNFLDRRITDQKICFSGNADFSTLLEIKMKAWRNPDNPHDYIFNVVVLRKKEQRIIGICTMRMLMEQELVLD